MADSKGTVVYRMGMVQAPDTEPDGRTAEELIRQGRTLHQGTQAGPATDGHARQERRRQAEASGDSPDGEFGSRVDYLLGQVADLLKEKNRKYGDSALHPARVFSKAGPVEQLLVRIDDKLTRIRNEQGDEDEDVVDDLIGYLTLLKLAREDERRRRC